MICFKKISIISYVPIAYSKVETIKCVIMRDVYGYCACTLILRSGLFTLRYSNSMTVLQSCRPLARF